jgi:hypothetical protein
VEEIEEWIVFENWMEKRAVLVVGVALVKRRKKRKRKRKIAKLG